MNSVFNLYCKSFRNDVLRARELLRSIERYNCDAIPFFISTPKDDRDIFKNQLGTTGYEWVADEEIAVLNASENLQRLKVLPGNISQQIIKSEFWRLNTCNSYLCLDSDSVFIKEFYRKNFFDSNNDLYTVAHESIEFFEEVKSEGQHHIYQNFKVESERIKSFFERDGKDYDFGPSPYIWSSKVWSWLSDYLLSTRGITLWDAISTYGTEDRWYGEALIKSKVIKFIPINQLFKVYHYKWQYINDTKKGIIENDLVKNYLGKIIQSNWDTKLNSSYVKNKPISRAFKSIKYFFSNKKI